jgi:hypothetical protein
VNPGIEFEAKGRMLQTMDYCAFGWHLARSLPEDEGVKGQHELMML